jgi:hypothetical protein
LLLNKGAKMNAKRLFICIFIFAVVFAALTVATEASDCESIQFSADGGKTWIDSGLLLETESTLDIGKRVTWTNRSTLVPNKAYNEELSPTELKTVQNTWLKVRYNACETKAILFAHGTKIDTLAFNNGVLFQLPSGQHEINVLNGELILWFDQTHQNKDISGRIVDQIRHGNFDIKSKLAFAVTDSLKDILPSDLLAGVQIVLLPAK